MNITEILDVVIGISLLVSVLVGYHRGLVLTIARIVAMIAAYVGARCVAVMSSGMVGQQLFLPMLERKMQEGILNGIVETAITDAAEGVAYSIIFFLVFVILEFVLLHLANGLKLIDHIPVVGKLNKLGGAVLGFIWVFLLFLLVGNVFFTYVPVEMQHRMGFTKKAVKQTILLNVFVP